ncbi:U3 small nucleolar ribonucleoprotein complex, subunit Mpp10 [Coemansia spiralis]|nr:U3 small nucleolar ribonucleoprotein complex, subunit Mpp10 [Coemansia spiralis]
MVQAQQIKAVPASKVHDNDLESVIPQSFIDNYISSPGTFVVPSTTARAAAVDVVGKTYDAANFADKFGLYDDWNAVKESGFDLTAQLWELVSFRNEPVLKYSADMMKQLSQLLDSIHVSNTGSSESEGEEDGIVTSEIDEEESIAELLEDKTSDSDEEIDEEQPDESVQGEQTDSDQEESSNEDEDGAKRSVIDDDFFSLAEMEKFADEAEEEDLRDREILAGNYPKNANPDAEESEDSEDDEDEDVDIFQDVGALEDDEEEDDDSDMVVDGKHRPDQVMYSDFFKAPKGSKRGKAKVSREKHAKRVRFNPSAVGESDEDMQDSDEQAVNGSLHKTNLFADDDSDKEDDSGSKSEFQKRQEKLQGLISKLEDEAVQPKHWTMVGEVTSSARPKDSLLGESLDFDYVQKPVPVVTQEATQTLEDVIKRRILNEEWDDVERKKDIQSKPFRPSAFIELNDKASKKSLAEEYEEQYLAQKSGDQFVPEKDAKLTDAHKAIDSQMRNLFTQLDALSHFHFAPKPATADIEIRTNAPALQMEEKLPVHVSQAEQLAPEEVYEKNKGYNGRTGDLKGDTELSREDRKRRRQRKKVMYKKTETIMAQNKGPKTLTAPPAAATVASTAKHGK